MKTELECLREKKMIDFDFMDSYNIQAFMGL